MSLKPIATLITIASLASTAGAETTMIFTLPYANSISPILFNNPTSSPPPNTAVIRTYDIGSTNQVPSWDVSSFTGLSTPAAQRMNLERTVDANWNGSTAVQVYQDNVAFQLHTYSAPFITGRYLKTINLEINFSVDKFVRPWSGAYGENAKLCTGFFAAAPSSWSGEGSANYAGANLSLRDVSTNKWFTIGAIFYSSIPAPEYIGFDGGIGGTNVPMVATYFGSQNLITTSPGSGSLRSSIWSQNTWFGFCLTKQNIQNIVTQVNANYPGNNFTVANLGLGSASIGGEIATGSNGANNGHMAVRLNEWNILIQH